LYCARSFSLFNSSIFLIFLKSLDWSGLSGLAFFPASFLSRMPLYPERFLYRCPKPAWNPFGIPSGPFEILGKACFAFQPSACFRAGNFQAACPDKSFKIIIELGKTHKTFKQRPLGLKPFSGSFMYVVPSCS
jgi:hypothetical protein